MATYKYLDSTGLGTVWGKIKNLIPYPDWNENSSSSPNYIKNRTHWREISGTVVAEEQTPTVDDYTYINYNNTFRAGDSVTVIYNGIIYSDMEAVNIGDFPTLINADENWKIVYDWDSSLMFFDFTELDSLPDSVTVSIINNATITYHKLDDNYIDVPHPDWAENNTADKDYIANKPPIKTGTGANSIIIGDSDNIASGICSIASGYQNISSNKYSIAFGETSKASGQDSVAIGAFLNLGTITLTGSASSLTYTDTATNQSTVDLLKRYGQSLFVWVNNKPIRLTSITSNENLLITFTFESTLSEEAITAVDYTLYAANIATGVGAMAFGHANRASGQNAFVFGTSNASTGTASFVEGKANEASNNQSHAEGFGTKSTGKQSHSEGRYTIAAGERSHAQGEYTTANGYVETAIGRYNILSNASAQTSYNTTNSPYILVAGNGTADNARSNAYTLDWSGNGVYAGKLTIGSNPVNTMDVATKGYVDNLTSEIPEPEDDINVLNLLTEFGYSAPLSDADNKVIVDVDDKLILG